MCWWWRCDVCTSLHFRPPNWKCQSGQSSVGTQDRRLDDGPGPCAMSSGIIWSIWQAWNHFPFKVVNPGHEFKSRNYFVGKCLSSHPERKMFASCKYELIRMQMMFFPLHVLKKQAQNDGHRFLICFCCLVLSSSQKSAFHGIYGMYRRLWTTTCWIRPSPYVQTTTIQTNIHLRSRSLECCSCLRGLTWVPDSWSLVTTSVLLPAAYCFP